MNDYGYINNVKCNYNVIVKHSHVYYMMYIRYYYLFSRGDLWIWICHDRTSCLRILTACLSRSVRSRLAKPTGMYLRMCSVYTVVRNMYSHEVTLTIYVYHEGETETMIYCQCWQYVIDPTTRPKRYPRGQTRITFWPSCCCFCWFTPNV